MKVLLTGGSGNLGQALVPRLLARGDTPVILDVRAPPLLNEGAMFIERSVLDRSRLTEIFRGCDCIVHIAAWHGIHEDRGEKNAYDFFDLNVRGTFEVFEAAASAGIGKVIYISTTSVYRPDTRYQQQDSRRTDRGGLPKAPPDERRDPTPARVYSVLGPCGVRQIQRLGTLVLERRGAY
jgi:nucleoside-diphosphate-sugar epimerase